MGSSLYELAGFHILLCCAFSTNERNKKVFCLQREYKCHCTVQGLADLYDSSTWPMKNPNCLESK